MLFKLMVSELNVFGQQKKTNKKGMMPFRKREKSRNGKINFLQN